MMNMKNKIVLVVLLLLLVISVGTITRNYLDNERNVYIAFFKQLEFVPDMKDVAFMNVISTCSASPEDIKEASEELFTGFMKANDKNTELYDMSIFSSMINVVTSQDARKYKEMPNVVNMKSEKNIVQISRVGFNNKKTQALLCVMTNFSASLYMFKKLNSSEWELQKYRNIWIS